MPSQDCGQNTVATCKAQLQLYMCLWKSEQPEKAIQLSFPQAEEESVLKNLRASGGHSFAFLDTHIGVNRAILNEQEAN